MAGTTLRITMLGPRGVGKTSLLASMYNEFDVAVKNIGGLTLIPSTETSRILSERLAELKRQTAVLSSGYDSSGTGVSGTAVSREFLFELGLIAKPMELKLIFTDFPGGFVAIQFSESYEKRHRRRHYPRTNPGWRTFYRLRRSGKTSVPVREKAGNDPVLAACCRTAATLQSEFYTARAGGQLSPFSQERVKRAS